jgi:hypothetical protein
MSPCQKGFCCHPEITFSAEEDFECFYFGWPLGLLEGRAAITGNGEQPKRELHAIRVPQVAA